jgi:DNA-binding CsgD family transcriptional regulator
VPGFAVTDASRGCVIRLWRRLDGVPLAIELATRRLRAIPLEQLADRLEDRFRLLTGGRRAALAHHQTIRAATEWSYDLRDALGEERYLALRHQGGGYALADIVQFAADGADELPPPGGVAAASGGAAPGGAAAAAGGAAAAADAGTAGLTSREWEIAGLVAEGLSNREIAGRLVISKRTVDAHIEHIYGKIGVSSRVQLASWLRTRPPPNE